jgi:hypothetical protein
VWSTRFVSAPVELKPADEIVRVADQAGFATASFQHFPVKPAIQNMVQVDVRQNGRNDPPLRGSCSRLDDGFPVFVQYPGTQPFPNQTQKRLIVYSPFQHLDEKTVIDVFKGTHDTLPTSVTFRPQ